jgi:hypothetical protein
MTGVFADLVRVATAERPPIPARSGGIAPNGGTVTDELIRLLFTKGRMSTRQLADAVDLSTRLVWGLLKTRLQRGQVVYSSGWWTVANGYGESSIEQIEWHPESRKPDSDITVLCWGSEGFFTGYWDDSVPGWIACESGGTVLGVTHWAQPEGPVA